MSRWLGESGDAMRYDMQHRPLAHRKLSLRWLATSVMAFACAGGFDTPSVSNRPEGAGGSSSVGGRPAAPQVDAGEGEEVENGGAAGTGGVNVPGGTSDAGGGAGGSAVVNRPPVCDAVTLVLLPHCGGGSCHSNPDARIGDWAANRAEAESFVDVPSVRNVSCGLIIDSADPSQSLLLRKLTGDFPSPMCGGFMPVSGGDLSDQEIACMASWLQQFKR